jgi:glucokinase
MYIAIDIGGTKTLVATLTDEGVIQESAKFLTPETYEDLLVELTRIVDSFTTKEFRAGTVGVPGTIDRKRGIVEQLGNRPNWKKLHILRDTEGILKCPMRTENDAKLGGLSESMLLKNQYKRVLYVTISTGIGIGLTVDGKIDERIGDGGGRTILLEHHDKLVPWETFASGSAIVQAYGKMASEIEDKATWTKIVRTFTPGLLELIAILEPEAIVIGGGAGHYLDRFHDLLVQDMKQYETPMLQIPPILPAKRPDEAVLYGCYDYARQKYA